MRLPELPAVSAQGWVPFLLGTALPERPYVAGGHLVGLLENLGHAAGAARVGLSRLCADGTVERRRSGRATSYRLSHQAAESIAAVTAQVERFGQEEAWDGTWTIVLASVPDDQRSTRRRMKNGLAYLGFGRLREAAWVAARACETEVKDLLENLEISGAVDVFVGRPSALADLDAIFRRCWDLDVLAGRYERFVSEFGHLAVPGAATGLPAEDVVRWWLCLSHDYRTLVFRDPGLPPAYLPAAARALRAEAVRTHAAACGTVGAPASDQILRALGIADL